VDGLRDEPDAMSLLPDIFTEGSIRTNLKIDYRKVKKHCNDLTYPLIDRLDVFDLVFGGDFLDMYESFNLSLREYIRGTDEREGLKSARGLIKELHNKMKTSGA